jgi:hypothetical protein
MKAQMSRNKWFLVAAALAAGCAATGGPDPTGTQNPGNADAGSTGPTGPTGPPEDAGPVPDAGGGIDSGPTGVALPFYVSDQFVPTGFMGDSQASMSAITLAHDTTTCKTPRQPGAGGDCFTATWTPQLGDAGSAWAGVYWQSPANNWGAKPGKAIVPGATKVSFYAAGAVGGETIQVSAGGINANGANASLPYGDTFTVKLPAVTLTTAWTKYELSLQGTSYASVLGGFCWVASTTASESVTFYIDDIQWE